VAASSSTNRRRPLLRHLLLVVTCDLCAAVSVVHASATCCGDPPERSPLLVPSPCPTLRPAWTPLDGAALAAPARAHSGWPAGGSLRAISMSATVRQAPALRGLPCPPLPAPGPSRPWKPAGRWRAIGAANHHRTKPAGDSAGQPLNRVFGRHRSDAVETVTFGLDGTHYEIDLNSDHAQELGDSWSATSRRPAKSPCPPAGRPVSAGPPQTTPGTRRYATGPGSGTWMGAAPLK
jgi:hypothetical protein